MPDGGQPARIRQSTATPVTGQSGAADRGLGPAANGGLPGEVISRARGDGKDAGVPPVAVEKHARTPAPEWLVVRAAEQLQVLGQPARLQLVEELLAGPRSPQELAGELGLTQQNVSTHLRVLYGVGVVSRRRAGTRVLYTLADEAAIDMLDRLAARASRRLRDMSRMAEGDR